MTNEMLMEYQNMIYDMTHYFEFYPNKEDLFQAGCIGLMTAYKKYDPSYGAKFSTYAYPHILGEMRRLVREEKPVKVSRNLRSLQGKIEKVRSLLEQQLMRPPTMQEISTTLDIPCELLEEAFAATITVQSMDMPITQDGKEMSLYDVIEAKEMDMDTLITLKQCISTMSEEEKQLLNLRFFQDKTQSEVAAKLGVNQVQISRQEKKIKQKVFQKVA